LEDPAQGIGSQPWPVSASEESVGVELSTSLSSWERMIVESGQRSDAKCVQAAIQREREV